jgi:hypothetical protein
MTPEVLSAALEAMRPGPRPLENTIKKIAEINEASPVTSAELWSLLRSAAPSDYAPTVFRQALAKWDNESDAAWTNGTERNTKIRRQLIYDRLKLDEPAREACDKIFPFRPLDLAVVIAKKHAIWYDKTIRDAHQFYWKGYKRQLKDIHGWEDDSILQLDDSTNRVVERLGNPANEAAYQSKGLVVGYVQSGKTSNFTGVIAKAADAGYKLIIVLAGTLDVLRSQTQRRVDKDMIGREQLLDQYEGDADFGDFISYGAPPKDLGSFNFMRLTGPQSDYASLRQGIGELAFERIDRTKPFWHPDNLVRATAKIAIVKKNSKILEKLIGDLKLVEKHRLGCPLHEIPALVIDDESDQASINVKKQIKSDDTVTSAERTATNKAIVQLLKLLPRSQYIGYTATPFANVFIDPNNEEDIFPKDFLISLPRPANYMGVSDFYDLDGDKKVPGSRPNHDDYVREVIGADDTDKNLINALDTFVLSGAIKLFRTRNQPRMKFKHHTMLVHASSRQSEHVQLRGTIQRLFDSAGYEGGPGLRRLKKLFEEDFQKISKIREPSLPLPADFNALTSSIGECLSKIRDVSGRPRERGDWGPILILNSENSEDTPDFDRQNIWKILVGGTKLSRGYTVEGLTVSYYRRRTGTADTLMQMGRWFGYRPYYRDLVRLFIGTSELVSKKGNKTIDLYEAFGGVCRDEEMFREELTRYALVGGITPREIPPLVPSHMLKPTAKNKMYNAVVEHRNFGGKLSEHTLAPYVPTDIEKNENRFERLLTGTNIESYSIEAKRDGKSHVLDVNAAILDPKEVVGFLKDYKWLRGNPMLLEVDFLQGTALRDPEIDDWLLFAPQVKDATNKYIELHGKRFFVVYRSREENNPKARFNTYNDPRHRRFAELIAGIVPKNPLTDPNESLAALCRPRRAVIMYYPITEKEQSVDKETKQNQPATTGFTLLFPPNKIVTPIQFTVRRPDLPDAIIVPAKK